MSSPKVLTPEEVARYRQQLALGVPLIMAAGPLLDSHEALRALVASTRRAALDEAADYVKSCREDDKGYRVVQVFDVLAKHLHEAAEGKRQLRDTPPPKETP